MIFTINHPWKSMHCEFRQVVVADKNIFCQSVRKQFANFHTVSRKKIVNYVKQMHQKLAKFAMDQRKSAQLSWTIVKRNSFFVNWKGVILLFLVEKTFSDIFSIDLLINNYFDLPTTIIIILLLKIKR